MTRRRSARAGKLHRQRRQEARVDARRAARGASRPLLHGAARACRATRILTDNWHTNEVLTTRASNFEGYTFAMRTLEAWGATIESDDAPTTPPADASGCSTSSRPQARRKRLPQDGPKARDLRPGRLGTSRPMRSHSAHRRYAGDRRASDLCAARSRLRRRPPPATPTSINELVVEQRADALVLDCSVLRHERIAVRHGARRSRPRRAADRDHQRYAGEGRRAAFARGRPSTSC